MAFDEKLAQRIREIVYGEKGASERKMFGGIAFMLDGHMCAGVIRDDLMARFPAALHPSMLEKSHVRPMDFTGRPMAGCVFVGRKGTRTRRQLAFWVNQGIEHARSLPPKKARKAPKKKRTIRRVPA